MKEYLLEYSHNYEQQTLRFVAISEESAIDKAINLMIQDKALHADPVFYEIAKEIDLTKPIQSAQANLKIYMEAKERLEKERKDKELLQQLAGKYPEFIKELSK